MWNCQWFLAPNGWEWLSQPMSLKGVAGARVVAAGEMNHQPEIVYKGKLEGAKPLQENFIPLPFIRGEG